MLKVSSTLGSESCDDTATEPGLCVCKDCFGYGHLAKLANWLLHRVWLRMLCSNSPLHLPLHKRKLRKHRFGSSERFWKPGVVKLTDKKVKLVRCKRDTLVQVDRS